ncbi:hypothetical protein EVAR_44567_1 [Eumeta japonica]|uniref:Uncharacterized protein n=1 Tax=Eumeta variegata TaxID=151549 RepID=A0A4C1X7X8_EUMVA|nr:hypothetical protein EVAR_44567_1 [Eumeta japonica]
MTRVLGFARPRGNSVKWVTPLSRDREVARAHPLTVARWAPTDCRVPAGPERLDRGSILYNITIAIRFRWPTRLRYYRYMKRRKRAWQALPQSLLFQMDLILILFTLAQYSNVQGRFKFDISSGSVSRAGPRSGPGAYGTAALHAGLTDDGRGRTVIYSDGLGGGLGPMLGNCVGHRVLNICMPGASLSDIKKYILLFAAFPSEIIYSKSLSTKQTIGIGTGQTRQSDAKHDVSPDATGRPRRINISSRLATICEPQPKRPDSKLKGKSRSEPEAKLRSDSGSRSRSAETTIGTA